MPHLNLPLPMDRNLSVEWRAHPISNLSLKPISCHTWIGLASGAQCFHLRRNNYRPKRLACWPHLHQDTFKNIDDAEGLTKSWLLRLSVRLASFYWWLFSAVWSRSTPWYKTFDPHGMKEYAGCTPEIIREAYQYRGTLQFIFLKLREVQYNLVHVIIQHTAYHKRDGDSRKYMTSALGDKVRQISPTFHSTRK